MECTTTSLCGTLTAIVTPFSASTSDIDYGSLENLIEFQIRSKVDGIVVCGSTGEAATLNDQEYKDVIKFTREKVKGRVLLVGGVGTSSTSRAIEMAKYINLTGLDAVMVVAPPYNKPPQSGIIAHFSEVKKNITIPLIAYNVPGRSGVNILPKTFQKLAEQKTIVGVKEACGSVDQILDLLYAVRTRVAVLSGDDSLTSSVMTAGGRGVISVVANFAPKLIKAITDAALRGDFAAASNAQFDALPFCRAAFAETNPIPAKTALKLMGIIKSDAMRLPLVPAEPSTKALLEELLKELKTGE